MTNLDSTFFNYIPILIGLFFVVLTVLTVFFKRRNNRHNYNRKLSVKILHKISAFEHDGQRMNYLRKINPFVFEELVLDAMEINGYVVKRNNRYTGDNGIDGIVYKDDNTYLVQAKRYTGYINMQHLIAFDKLVNRKKCKGYFIHTGKTGKGSRLEEKKMTNTSIISGSTLLNLLKNLNNNLNK